MQTTLGSRLHDARIATGLSQSDVAAVVHVSRQSVSKWENDHGYPDLDNLAYLSRLYHVSVDQLLNGDEAVATDDIATPSAVVEPAIPQNRNEGLLLLVLALVSALIPPVGIFVPMYVMWRNNPNNRLYKMIYLICALVIFVSIWGTYIFVADNFLPPQTHVYRVN